MMNSRRISLPSSLRSPSLSPKDHLSPISPYQLSSSNLLSPLSSPSRNRRSLPTTPRSNSPRFDSSNSSSPRTHRYILEKVEENSQMDEFPNESKGRIPKMKEMDNIQQPMRSFDLTSRGIIDRGLYMVDKTKIDHRRSTCPDIYLYSPEDRLPPRRVILRVYGSGQSGKRTVAQQIYQQAVQSNRERHTINNDCGSQGRIINFILNGEKIQVEILIESALESDLISSETIYTVVYRVDSRDSLTCALNLISRLPKNPKNGRSRAILIGNKCDLQRSRVVSTIEGRTLAKIYKVPFVEVSALMSLNSTNLWETILRFLSPLPPTRSIFGRVVDSCEQLVRNALSLSPRRSIDEEDSNNDRSTPRSSRDISPNRLNYASPINNRVH